MKSPPRNSRRRSRPSPHFGCICHIRIPPLRPILAVSLRCFHVKSEVRLLAPKGELVYIQRCVRLGQPQGHRQL